jgi:hypothetical protein
MRRGLVVAMTLLFAGPRAAGAQDESAAALFARGDFPAAASAYEAVLRAHPGDHTSQLGLAAIRVYQNNLAAAEPLLDAVLDANPQNARATQLLAEVIRRRSEAARRSTLDGALTRVPFVASDPLPVVRVTANGVSANFVVDTGGDVDLEPSFAQRAGVKLQGGGTGVFAGGLREAMQRGMLHSLALGGATAYDVPVHVMPTHASALFPKLQIDGIVGTTYFERFLVTIDYPENALILQPRSPRVSAVFQAQAVAAGATVVPCYLVSDHFVFAQARVNDAPPGLFLFDTGLAGAGFMPSAQFVRAANIQLDEASTTTGVGGGGGITGVPFVTQRIAVGTAVQQNIRGTYTPQGDPFGLFPFQVWGAISNDFLRPYAYTVDFEAMKIVLDPQPPKSD